MINNFIKCILHPTRFILSLTILLQSTFAYAVEVDSKTETLIRELGLRESDVPANQMQGYRKPKRIFITALAPEAIKSFQAVAPGVEIVASREYIPRNIPKGNFDVVISGCRKPVIEVARHASWFQAISAGVEGCINHPVIRDNKNLLLTNNKRVGSSSLAEYSISMILILARGYHIYRDNQIEKNWQRRAIPLSANREIQGQTLLVTGLGGIGEGVARRAHALGMRVIATRNSSRTGPEYVEYVGLANELLELTRQADFIVNTLPLTRTTTGIFDADFFKTMKDTAYFITVGRGKSVVTSDLIAALEAGELAGAALDVLEQEPLPVDSPLWGMKNVIITPHVAGTTRDSRQRSVVIIRENLRRYVNGEPMLNVVDKVKGY